MKFRLTLLPALLLLTTASCDKARDLGEKFRGSKSTPVATSGPADVRDLSAAEFDSFIATPDRLMVVDFHAEWCGPCKVLGPVLEQVAGEFPGRVSIGKVDVDQARDLAAREQVSSIPDVRLYRDGKMVHKFVGALDASAVRALFKEHTSGLKAPAEEPADASGTAAAKPEPTIQPMKKDWLPPGIEKR